MGGPMTEPATLVDLGEPTRVSMHVISNQSPLSGSLMALPCHKQFKAFNMLMMCFCYHTFGVRNAWPRVSQRLGRRM